MHLRGNIVHTEDTEVQGTRVILMPISTYLEVTSELRVFQSMLGGRRLLRGV